ncbi:hypothetical protein SLS58_000569 [Diplodia intermedia]|uniref:Uncharacterized protein n=1 Tax=Diplodia intermedia TaxID=856260 RepID=A0ABR3U4L5_9PEZI
MPHAKDHAPPTAPVFGSSHQSPALGGMEQSISSFRDFVKSTPPPPSSPAPHRKPLPPIPLSQRPSLGPVSQSSSLLTDSLQTSRSDNFLKRRTVAPWTAEDEMDPAERSLEPPKDFFLQPATYTASNPSLSKPEPQQLPLLQPRRFELLIPDPSREPSPEVRTPAFEYEHHVEFPPSPASSKPPQTPLPPIPGASTIDPVAKPKDPSVLNSRSPTPPSPAPSPKGTRVVIPAATTVSEGASFVISPFSLTSPISPWTGAEDSSLYQNHYRQSTAASTTSPRRLVPRSAAPGADNEWEEDFEEETARIRRDRLSQDYHQALVEQYRELVSPTSEIFGAVADMEEEQNHEVLRDPPSCPKPSKGGDKDNDGLVPLPLKPRKDSPDRPLRASRPAKVQSTP